MFFFPTIAEKCKINAHFFQFVKFLIKIRQLKNWFGCAYNERYVYTMLNPTLWFRVLVSVPAHCILKRNMHVIYAQTCISKVHTIRTKMQHTNCNMRYAKNLSRNGECAGIVAAATEWDAARCNSLLLLWWDAVDRGNSPPRGLSPLPPPQLPLVNRSWFS
jgi:hypothetical protein